MINPLTRYFVWKAAEREADRQLVREGIDALKSAFDAQAKVADVFKTYLDSFSIPSAPLVREWDEVEDTKNYLERTGRALPDELKGLNQFDQFSAILARMDDNL